MNVIIHPFPAPGDNNMFLKLFYDEVHLKALGNTRFTVQPLSLGAVFQQVRRDRSSHRIIHVHWEAVLYGSRFFLKSIPLMFIRFSALFVLKRVYGIPICWTMHNYRSHDYPHPVIDRIGRKILFGLADGVIIQQRGPFERYQAEHPEKRVRYIPLGNYIGAYGKASRPQADVRRRYGLQEGDLVILSFGIVKPYKKIEAIIRVFRDNADAIDPRIKLCIVGTATKKYAAYLERLIDGHPQILFINEFVKDDEMADLLEMADYSIFWYDNSVLTSGGLALSLSYGLPAIIRDVPAAERIRNGENGLLFDNARHLAAILSRLTRIPQPPKEQVIRSIAGDSWATLSKDYMAFCLELLHSR